VALHDKENLRTLNPARQYCQASQPDYFITSDLTQSKFDSAVSSTSPKPSEKKVGDEVAKAFEQEYKESHPNGPYPSLEPKPKPERA
jgi:hypothetical protein